MEHLENGKKHEKAPSKPLWLDSVRAGLPVGWVSLKTTVTPCALTVTAFGTLLLALGSRCLVSVPITVRMLRLQVTETPNVTELTEEWAEASRAPCACAELRSWTLGVQWWADRVAPAGTDQLAVSFLAGGGGWGRVRPLVTSAPTSTPWWPCQWGRSRNPGTSPAWRWCGVCIIGPHPYTSGGSWCSRAWGRGEELCPRQHPALRRGCAGRDVSCLGPSRGLLGRLWAGCTVALSPGHGCSHRGAPAGLFLSVSLGGRTVAFGEGVVVPVAAESRPLASQHQWAGRCVPAPGPACGPPFRGHSPLAETPWDPQRGLALGSASGVGTGPRPHSLLC